MTHLGHPLGCPTFNRTDCVPSAVAPLGSSREVMLLRKTMGNAKITKIARELMFVASTMLAGFASIVSFFILIWTGFTVLQVLMMVVPAILAIAIIAACGCTFSESFREQFFETFPIAKVSISVTYGEEEFSYVYRLKEIFESINEWAKLTWSSF